MVTEEYIIGGEKDSERSLLVTKMIGSHIIKLPMNNTGLVGDQNKIGQEDKEQHGQDRLRKNPLCTRISFVKPFMKSR